MVKFTVVPVWAVFGVTLSMLGCGVGVMAVVGDGKGKVAEGAGTVGEAGAEVFVGTGVKVTTVAVGETGVNVKVGAMVGAAEVGDGMGEAVGVITIGLPNSLQPRSGAAPVNPMIG